VRGRSRKDLKGSRKDVTCVGEEAVERKSTLSLGSQKSRPAVAGLTRSTLLAEPRGHKKQQRKNARSIKEGGVLLQNPSRRPGRLAKRKERGREGGHQGVHHPKGG